MQLATLDWIVIVSYVVLALSAGLYISFKSNHTDEENSETFFVGNRNLNWFIAGTSMVATTFAVDTPLYVTGVIAKHGISFNWQWWCWGIGSVIATFFFADLWRRANVITDAEIIELRYSGKNASYLRAFKAIYFGVFKNVIVMGWVILAMLKISGAFFNIDPIWVLVICITISLVYTTTGGFKAVVVTDVLQFCIGMLGSIILMAYVLSHFNGIGPIIEGLNQLPSPDGENNYVSFFPQAVKEIPNLQEGEQVFRANGELVTKTLPTDIFLYFIAVLCVGWWKTAEGSGYIVQRLSACKNEANAVGASLWFAFAHNALRPWPWIIVGMGALLIYKPLKVDQNFFSKNDDTVKFLGAGLESESHRGTEISFLKSKKDKNEKIVWENMVFDNPKNVTLLVNDLKPQEIKPNCIQPFFKPKKCAFKIKKVSKNENITMQLAFTHQNKSEVHYFENIPSGLVDRESGYPLLMKEFLPAGLLGLVIVSLLAAFMSTIDTHTNWGSSYIVQDVYLRFINPKASINKQIWISRFTIIGLAVLGGVFAYFSTSIGSIVTFIVALSAGLGSVSALRWYWPKVNAESEFVAIVISTLCAFLFTFGFIGVSPWQNVLLTGLISLLFWIPVAIFGPENSKETLKAFANKIQPPGPGWTKHYTINNNQSSLGQRFIQTLLGLIIVYGGLFGLGYVIYGQYICGLCLMAFALITTWVLFTRYKF